MDDDGYVGTCLARDIANLHTDCYGPDVLSSICKEIANDCQLDFTVLDVFSLLSNSSLVGTTSIHWLQPPLQCWKGKCLQAQIGPFEVQVRLYCSVFIF